MGSIAAIVGAAWISNREARERSTADKVRAIVTASNMLKPLEFMISDIQALHAFVVEWISQGEIVTSTCKLIHPSD